MHICPVGAIIVRGESMTRPFGDRKYDMDMDATYVPHDNDNSNGNDNSNINE